MKTKRLLAHRVALLAFAILHLQLTTLVAQTTSFTYQGQLTENGSPANGFYDLQFALFDAVSAGTQQGSTITTNAVPVSGGLFTVTLDFGNQFPGANRWLEISSRSNTVGSFGLLSPRQQITSAPYAIRAANATAATSFSGSLAGDVTGNQGATAVANVGGQTAANVASGANAANAASVTAVNTIVKRDASGNFSAGTITATNFSGSGTALTGLTASQIPNLDAAKITTGTLNDGLLSANVALLNRTPQTFTGTNIFNARVGLGESSPLATLHVQASDIGVDATAVDAVAPETMMVESTDALLGLISNSSGGYGSGIAFKEFVSGGFSNTWGIIRRTTPAAGGPELRLTFGTTANIAGNPTLFTFATNGNMSVITGNLGVGTSSPTNKLHVVGGATFASGSAGANQVVVWTPGSGSWSFTSDRNTKDRVASVDSQSVLEKLARIPIHEWSYIGYDQRHIGPMAQDFHAAFPLNENNQALNDADLHGVALAAIQGLNQKLTEKLKSRDAENLELKQSVNELKALVKAMNEKLDRTAK